MPEISIQTYVGPKAPFQHTHGPRNASIALVGEAWGESEDQQGAPFVGASGQELTRMLGEAGLARRDIFLTNVLALRPQRNDIEALCVHKAEAGPLYPMPPLRMGKYLHPKFLPELERLKAELGQVKPNLVVACGNTALWALCARTNISALRGSTSLATLLPSLKVLPTFHPASVLRKWDQRPIVIADLLKAKLESEFPEIRRPERWITINPTLDEILEWTTRPASRYAVDIETLDGQITMIGFARSAQDAIVIPFVDRTHPGSSYWPDEVMEGAAWRLVRALLESPVPKIFQNGLYDLQYLAKMGFRPRACHHDTMLLHHSLFPELQKGLGFLGSIYSNEASWKLMRHQESNKRDE